MSGARPPPVVRNPLSIAVVRDEMLLTQTSSGMFNIPGSPVAVHASAPGSSSRARDGARRGSVVYTTDRFRALKTSYAFLCCLCPIVTSAMMSIALTATTWFQSSTVPQKTSGPWLASYFGVLDYSYAAISPIYANSTCVPLVAGGRALYGCRDLGDAVTGATYLVLAVAVIILVNVAISVHELARFGPFGGSKSYARVGFVLSLASVATAALLLATWSLVLVVSFCDAPTMQDRGFAFGWPWYVCVGLLALLLLDLVDSARAVSRTYRGPPSMTILRRTVALCVACLGISAQGWLVHKHIPTLSFTGAGDACVSFEASFPCPVVSLYVKLLTTAVCVTVAVGIACTFFMSARAVDHRGMTLSWSTFSGVALLLGVGGTAVGIFAMSTVSGQSCAVPQIKSVAEIGFEFGSAAWLLCPAVSGAVLFVIMNGAYSLRCAVARPPMRAAPRGGGRSGLAAAMDPNASVDDAFRAVADESPQSRVGHRNQHSSAIADAGHHQDLTAAEDVASVLGLDASQPGGQHPMSGVPTVHKRYLYHQIWWDGLCDPRTASITARENDDADQSSGSDAEDWREEAGRVLRGVAATQSSTSAFAAAPGDAHSETPLPAQRAAPAFGSRFVRGARATTHQPSARRDDDDDDGAQREQRRSPAVSIIGDDDGPRKRR